jgi:hypothetical protein
MPTQVYTAPPRTIIAGRVGRSSCDTSEKGRRCPNLLISIDISCLLGYYFVIMGKIPSTAARPIPPARTGLVTPGLAEIDDQTVSTGIDSPNFHIATVTKYPPFDKDLEFAINGGNLSKLYRGTQNTLQRLCLEKIGDIANWDGDTEIISIDGVQLEFYRRSRYGKATAAIIKDDLSKVEKAFGLKLIFPQVDNRTEFAVNGGSLRDRYRDKHRLKDICDAVLGDVDEWDDDVKVVTRNGATATFLRRRNGVSPTAAATKADRANVETVLGLKSPYADLDTDTEFAVNGHTLNDGYRGSARKLKALCDEVIGDIDSWDSEHKRITRNGVSITFYQRITVGSSTAAILNKDRQKLEGFFEIEKLFPKLDSKNEFAVNGVNLSNVYRGANAKFKKQCDEVLGDLESWDSNQKTITHNGVTIVFYRRSHSGNLTAAVKLVDLVKLEEQLELKALYPSLDQESEFAVNAASLVVRYSGDPYRIKGLHDQIIGDIDKWDSDSKKITNNGVELEFFRRKHGSNPSAAIKKSDQTKLDEFFDLRKKIPKQNFSEEGIVEAAREFYQIHGKFPNNKSLEPVPGMPMESWKKINNAGRDGSRGIETGRTIAKILEPLRTSQGLRLSHKRLPRIFQDTTKQARVLTARSSRKELRSHLSLNKSRNVNFLKGECFEQVVGLLLLSHAPNETVIPQYCLIVDPKRAYFGMRADYAVTRADGERDIYEVKWGKATENISETATKHKDVLGLKKKDYHMILLETNPELREEHALFSNLNQGLASSASLNSLIVHIKDLVETNKAEELEVLRGYLYGLVIKANSFKSDERISFIQDELEGFLASDDHLAFAKEHCYAWYAPLEAYVEYEGKLCRELICPKALIEEKPDAFSLNYQLGDIGFEDFRDIDLAVKMEMSGLDDSSGLNIDNLLVQDQRHFNKAIFTLPDGETVSCHEDLNPDHLIQNPGDIRSVLDFSDGNYEFAESFIKSYLG